jgi:hypothetical protein
MNLEVQISKVVNTMRKIIFHNKRFKEARCNQILCQEAFSKQTVEQKKRYT